MAGSPQHRVRFTTDPELLRLATRVDLRPPVSKTVLYAEDEGAERAQAFVRQNPRHTRLDDLLQLTPPGQTLWRALTRGGRPWADVEEVWWELSWRLARNAKGVVHVFGPSRLVEDRPLEDFRHRYSTGSFAHTVFEKVELPELEANPKVTAIFYNGQPFA